MCAPNIVVYKDILSSSRLPRTISNLISKFLPMVDFANYSCLEFNFGNEQEITCLNFPFFREIPQFDVDTMLLSKCPFENQFEGNAFCIPKNELMLYISNKKLVLIEYEILYDESNIWEDHCIYQCEVKIDDKVLSKIKKISQWDYQSIRKTLGMTRNECIYERHYYI